MLIGVTYYQLRITNKLSPNVDNCDLIIPISLGCSPLFLSWIRFNPITTQVPTQNENSKQKLSPNVLHVSQLYLSQVQTVILVHLGLITTTNNSVLGFVYSDFPIPPLPPPLCLQFLLLRRPSACNRSSYSSYLDL